MKRTITALVAALSLATFALPAGATYHEVITQCPVSGGGKLWNGTTGADNHFDYDGEINCDGGNFGNDSIHTYDRDDLAAGDEGSDRIWGGAGHDRLWGDQYGDDLMGENGNDDLYGGSGGDYLYGGRGQDALYGGDGPDRLFDSTGDDYISGGNGDDTFYRCANDGYNDAVTGVEYVSTSEMWCVDS